MSDELLATARELLVHSRFTPATAYAAADAAETARAMHTTLEGILQAVDSMESLLHDIRGPISVPVREAQGASAPHDGATNPGEGSRERGGSLVEPPDAPVTPQEGEVWEDATGRVRVKLDRRCSGPTNLRHPWLWHGTVVAIGAPSGWEVGDPVGLIELDQDDWRRVSPAPAPLTEREVTAEAAKPACDPAADAKSEGASLGVEPEIVTFPLVAESLDEGADEDRRRERAMFFGAEPASDEQIARDSVAVMALQRHHRERYHRLIARVRAEHARAEAAEAQVALMEPVVRVATAPAVTAGALVDAARAYREATRDA